MDFSSINGLSYSTAQANVNSANANSLTNSLNKISSESTEEELKGVLKDFESYFVEQVLKQMKETFTDEEEGDATMSQYKNLYMDQATEMVADEIADQVGENFTQQLYEQMKRNYNME